MIDIHNHILYGLDDGAKTLEESIEMCQISFNDGVRIIVATPHTLNPIQAVKEAGSRPCHSY